MNTSTMHNSFLHKNKLPYTLSKIFMEENAKNNDKNMAISLPHIKRIKSDHSILYFQINKDSCCSFYKLQ